MKILVVIDDKRSKEYTCSSFKIAFVGGSTVLEVRQDQENLAVFKTFDYIEKLKEEASENAVTQSC